MRTKYIVVQNIVIIIILLWALIITNYDQPNTTKIGISNEYNENIANICFTLEINSIEINDTLFFVVKNDSTISVETKYRNLIIRRYKSEY